MPQLRNTPEQPTVLQLFARKSFALGIWIQDKNENPLDINAVELTIVMRKSTASGVSDDSDNLIVNNTATIVAPALGYARFDLQASDLNHAPGTYEFVITMLDQGYSSGIVSGEIELIPNPEFGSVGETYTSADVATALTVALREQHVIKVSVGPTLAPGQATFTTDMEQKLLEMYAGLAAAGMTLTADDIADGTNKLFMTSSERTLLQSLQLAISTLPSFGTIVSHSEDDYLPSTGIDASKTTTGVFDENRIPIVSELKGISFSDSEPSSIPEGHFVFQYEA